MEKIKNENIYKQKKEIEENIEKILNEKSAVGIIKRRKKVLVIILLVIMGLGILNISSISYYRDGILNKWRYCLYLFLGIISFFILSKIDYKVLKTRKISSVMYLFSLIILSFLAIGGKYFPNIVREVNGARGWITIKGIGTIQPAELLKIIYIIFLSKTLSIFEEKKNNSGEIINSFLIFAGFAFFIFLQNDLGTIIHYFLIYLFMIFFTKLEKQKIIKFIVGASSVSFLALYYIYNSSKTGYKIVRIKMFLDGIFKNSYIGNIGEGYQVAQSLLGFGNGGILGRSYGSGVQKYNYLPEIHTDFIMALFGEEFGFIGVMFVILLFFLLYNLILEIGLNAKDKFGKFLAIGIGGLIITQFLINFFVVLGLLPVFGIPMPIFSYGGSSIITIMVSMGIVGSINNIHLFDKKLN